MPSFLRTVRTALTSLRRKLVRSALTCFGIVTGIAAVIFLMEFGQGTSRAIRERIASIGANQLWVEAGASIKGGVSAGAGTVTTLTPQDREAILRECSTVRWAAPGVDCRMQVIYGNRNWAPWKVLGTTPDYLLVRDWAELEDGAAFTDADVRGSAAVCLIGQTPLRELFDGESPLGKQVRVNGVPLRVVGVLTRKGANMMGMDQDDVIIAPWTTVKFRINGAKLAFSSLPAATSPLNQVNTLGQPYPGQPLPLLYTQPSSMQMADTPVMRRFSDLNDIFVSVNSPEEVPLAVEQITQLLRRRHRLRDDQPLDFRIRDMTEISRALGATTLRMTALLLAVAVLTLTIGGVGIMNIMLATVTERTREIGIRMAVGARARDILWQFLTEAVVLCLLGGVAGIVLGRGISEAVTAFLGWPTDPSLAAVLVALAVASAVGVAFGYYPAWKASRLDPVAALNYE
jgi:ABC-type antimicrobial peptide transport system permease subunit